MRGSWVCSGIIPRFAQTYGRIILKCILEKEDRQFLTELICMRIGTSGLLM